MTPGKPQITRRRCFVSGQAPPGPLYRPLVPMAAHLAGYFTAQPITDADGALHPNLVADLGDGGQCCRVAV